MATVHATMHMRRRVKFVRKYGDERDIFLLENPYVSGACDLWTPLGLQVGPGPCARTHKHAHKHTLNPEP